MKSARAGTEKDHYMDAFARLRKESGKRSWTLALREQAMARFADIGFPTLQEEEWRKTRVAPILGVPFQPQARYTANGFTARALERYTFEPWECTHLVFINGHYAAGLSRLRPLPEGAIVEPMSQALERRRAEIEPHLARHADVGVHAFAALNTAFMQDGVFVRVADGVSVDEALHLLFISTGGGEPVVSYPRNLIVAGKGSRVSVVESYVGPHEGLYFTQAGTEVEGGERAQGAVDGITADTE